MKIFLGKHKVILGLVGALVLIGVLAGSFVLANRNWNQDSTTTESETATSLAVVTTTEAPTEEETEETTTEEKETKDYLDGGKKMFSLLSGEPISKEIGQRRPLAIMINNIGEAVPQQCSLEEADVIYEATVEHDITRLMGLYERYDDVEKFGTVRSCRFYFAYWATEWDALYCHFGQSGYAMDFLYSGKIDILNSNDDTSDVTYYRDPNYVAPHNVYATVDGINSAAAIKGYTMDYKKDYKGHFKFTDYGTTVKLGDGMEAGKIEMNFPVDSSYFVYDKKNKVYKRYQYGVEHIDALTGKQLTTKNILVQKADAPMFDDGISINFQIVGEGSGYYFTEGKGMEVTWKKDADTSITHFYNKKGKEITINTGKTWICVMPSTQEVTISK